MNDKENENLDFPELIQIQRRPIQPLSIPIESKPNDTSLGASFSPVMLSPFLESAGVSGFPDPATLSRNSSGLIDPEHVERLSSFVRHHRESVSLGRKRPSYISLTPQSALPNTQVPSDGSIQVHSRNGSTGAQSIFEAPLLKAHDGQSAISLLSVSPRPISYIKEKESSYHGTSTVSRDSKRVSELGNSSELPAVVDEKTVIEISPTDSTRHLNYTDKYDPQIFGQIIFKGDYDEGLINLQTTNLAALLGKKYVHAALNSNHRDTYHTVALHAYMDAFDFTDITIDQAFRTVCRKLDFVGETQVVDRILFQIARRYWDCNDKAHTLFKSIDITYGILFSLVLLNTDLHIANVGNKEYNKMNRKDFLKNTMDLIETMMNTNSNIENGVKDEPKKKWKREMEEMLKDFYASIRDNSLMQTTIEVSRKNSVAASFDTGSSVGTSDIKRNSSTWSLSSAVSAGSLFSVTSTSTSSLKRSSGNFFKRNLLFSPSSIRMSKSVERISSSPQDIHDVIFQGVAIRKHLLEKGDQKARNRRWVKYWVSLKCSPERVELVMSQFEHRGSMPFDQTATPTSYNKPPTGSLSPGALKFSRSEPDTFNLLHSITQALRPMAYSSKRPHVFSILLANGSTYLFHVPSSQIKEEWVRHLNYQVAKKSKEPLRDVLSSTDYGWSQLEWARKKADLDKAPLDLNSLAKSLAKDKIRLEDWEPPSYNFGPVLVSHLDDEKQLQNIEKQVLLIQKELHQHESYKEAIDVMYSDAAIKVKALNNWLRKQKYLESEAQKYVTYANALKKAPASSRDHSMSLDRVAEDEQAP